MHLNFDDFAEYSEAPQETDYANPSYYQQDMSKTPRSAQPVQQLQSYSDYMHGPTVVNSYDPAMTQEYHEFSGSSQDYTGDVGTETPESSAKEKPNAGSMKRKGLAGLGGIGAAIGALLLKFPLLSVFLKFGWAGISAIVSIVVYSYIFGWQFAVGLVALLFIHEMGHALVMKLKGIPVGGMIFIPMLGAAVTMRQMPQNARDEAEVGIAGPIAGAIASSICLILAGQAGASPIWAALAYFGFFMNLFNLIPIVPFDGGRVLAAIDRRVWILGFLGLLGFFIWQWVNGSFSPWLLLFVILAATQLLSRNKATETAEGKAYYDVPVMTRITLGVLYFGLAAVLVLGMTMSHSLIPGLAN